jgi:hypothetical protein
VYVDAVRAHLLNAPGDNRSKHEKHLSSRCSTKSVTQTWRTKPIRPFILRGVNPSVPFGKVGDIGDTGDVGEAGMNAISLPRSI